MHGLHVCSACVLVCVSSCGCARAGGWVRALALESTKEAIVDTSLHACAQTEPNLGARLEEQIASDFLNDIYQEIGSILILNLQFLWSFVIQHLECSGFSGMPTNPELYADDLVSTLKKKHALGTYKSMVFYLEACESGSIFEGLLPENMNIYATTASNASKSSWGTYYPGDSPSPPPEYWTCLGDLYSVSWMEDSDVHNLRTESLKQQYELVKFKTSLDHNAYNFGSHVMQYGSVGLNVDHLFLYMGSNPTNDNATFVDGNSLPSFSRAVNQRDADLVYYWQKFQRSPEGSSKKLDAQKQLLDVMNHRVHVDNSIELVGKLLFGSEKGVKVLETVRPAGQPLVDDWDCLKAMVRSFESHCGSLSQYGMKHMRSLANVCNAGIKKETMDEVAAQACPHVPANPWSALHKGFSA